MNDEHTSPLEHHVDDPCVSCMEARRRAALIGVGIGVAIAFGAGLLVLPFIARR